MWIKIRYIKFDIDTAKVAAVAALGVYTNSK